MGAKMIIAKINRMVAMFTALTLIFTQSSFASTVATDSVFAPAQTPEKSYFENQIVEPQETLPSFEISDQTLFSPDISEPQLPDAPEVQEGNNYAVGIVPTVSSYYEPADYNPSRATDGNWGDTSVGWGGSQADGKNEWLQVDLGSPRWIDGLQYDTRFHPYFGNDIWQESFRISGSLDGINWFELAGKDGLTAPELFQFQFQAQQVRYVRAHDIRSHYPKFAEWWHFAYVNEIGVYASKNLTQQELAKERQTKIAEANAVTANVEQQIADLRAQVEDLNKGLIDVPVFGENVQASFVNFTSQLESLASAVSQTLRSEIEAYVTGINSFLNGALEKLITDYSNFLTALKHATLIYIEASEKHLENLNIYRKAIIEAHSLESLNQLTLPVFYVDLPTVIEPIGFEAIEKKFQQGIDLLTRAKAEVNAITPFQVSVSTLPGLGKSLTIEVAADGTAKVTWYQQVRQGAFDPQTGLIEIDFSEGSNLNEWRFKLEKNGESSYFLKEFAEMKQANDGTSVSTTEHYFTEAGNLNGRLSTQKTSTAIRETRNHYSYAENGRLAVNLQLEKNDFVDGRKIYQVSYNVADYANRQRIFAESYLTDDHLFNEIDSVEELDAVNPYILSRNIAYFKNSDLAEYLYGIIFTKDANGDFTRARTVSLAGVNGNGPSIYIVNGQPDVLSDETDDELFKDYQDVNGYRIWLGGSAVGSDPMTYGLVFAKKIVKPALPSSDTSGAVTPSFVIIAETFKVMAIVDYPRVKTVELEGKHYRIQLNAEGILTLHEYQPGIVIDPNTPTEVFENYVTIHYTLDGIQKEKTFPLEILTKNEIKISEQGENGETYTAVWHVRASAPKLEVVIDPNTPAVIYEDALTINYTFNGEQKQKTFTNLAPGENRISVIDVYRLADGTGLWYWKWLTVTVDLITPVIEMGKQLQTSWDINKDGRMTLEDLERVESAHAVFHTHRKETSFPPQTVAVFDHYELIPFITAYKDLLANPTLEKFTARISLLNRLESGIRHSAVNAFLSTVGSFLVEKGAILNAAPEAQALAFINNLFTMMLTMGSDIQVKENVMDAFLVFTKHSSNLVKRALLDNFHKYITMNTLMKPLRDKAAHLYFKFFTQVDFYFGNFPDYYFNIDNGYNPHRINHVISYIKKTNHGGAFDEDIHRFLDRSTLFKGLHETTEQFEIRRQLTHQFWQEHRVFLLYDDRLQFYRADFLAEDHLYALRGWMNALKVSYAPAKDVLNTIYVDSFARGQNFAVGEGLIAMWSIGKQTSFIHEVAHLLHLDVPQIIQAWQTKFTQLYGESSDDELSVFDAGDFASSYHINSKEDFAEMVEAWSVGSADFLRVAFDRALNGKSLLLEKILLIDSLLNRSPSSLMLYQRDTADVSSIDHPWTITSRPIKIQRNAAGQISQIDFEGQSYVLSYAANGRLAAVTGQMPIYPITILNPQIQLQGNQAVVTFSFEGPQLREGRDYAWVTIQSDEFKGQYHLVAPYLPTCTNEGTLRSCSLTFGVDVQRTYEYQIAVTFDGRHVGETPVQIFSPAIHEEP